MRPQRVLVIDDSDSVREHVRRVLESDGHDVIVAAGAADALRNLSSATFDLVLCDLVMPDMDGMKLLSFMKSNGDLDQIPVIMLTSKTDVESKVGALGAGATDYLTKPFDDGELLARARVHLHLKQLQDELRSMATRDPLTGLFNHAYLQDRLQQEIKRCDRHAHELGLIFIDVDHFKELNDSLGHQIGDALLTGIGGILSARSDPGFCLREHDVPARYGGDEFVLLLPETSRTGATTIAERLRRHVEQRRFDELPGGVTLSIGVAAYPMDAETREELLSAADAALYAAKTAGRNRVVTYTPSLRSGPAATRASHQKLQAMARAIEKRAFRMVYQPLVNVETISIVGYEALARPDESIGDSIVDLIEVAERIGLVVELGQLLRQLAIAPLAKLPSEQLLFFNLHPFEIYDPTLFVLVAELGADARRVVLEITEVTAIRDFARLNRVIDELRARGVLIAVDDLASGYAGIHALAQIRADFVKLDRTLVKNVVSDARTARLVRHLVQYAADEGIDVVAEGVETREQFEATRDLGCRLAQGFYFAEPGPPFVGLRRGLARG